MANPVLGKSLCSDWFFLGQDFAVRTVSMDLYFCYIFKICSQNSEKKCEYCHSSRWNYQKKLKRLKFFQNFKDGWRKWTFLNASHRQSILLSETVPYNKLLTNLAFSSRTGEYWPLVVFVWTSLRSVRTVTTSGQYSPVRSSCLVFKRLLFVRNEYLYIHFSVSPQLGV